MIALRYRILGIAAALVAVSVAAGAFTLSHNSPCGDAESPPGAGERMQAVVYRCYGPASVLEVTQVEKPEPADNEVLVKVRAAAINPVDWYMMTGRPYIMRLAGGLGTPGFARFGVDYAGVVVAVGENVTRFKPGDEVFGARSGALAEYVTADAERTLALKPPNIGFEQAAAIPVAAITALQGLRDQGRIQPGDKVLINGASGGVGTFAVQIAKAFGAEVTGVCSTRNVELVRSLGADRVIDYTQQSIIDLPERYDLILDNAGNHSPFETRRVLAANGTLVIVGGPKDNPWIGPLSRPLQAMFLQPFVRQELVFFIADLNRDDIETLGELVRTGKVTPVIDRVYPLPEVAQAVDYLATGHARAKIVVTLD
ncbi:MAG TPA: NAD(P)-dependent alcohol dehydrogenase [Woeseiaceae bacterium]